MSEEQHTPLIPFAPRQLGIDTVQTVNAQDIHAFLEVKTRFDKWIERRIETYGFQEGRDFTTVNSGQGPVRTIEYHVSFDMAKELSMVEKTSKGKEARQWFLQCERRAVPLPALAPKTPAEMFLAQAHINVELEQRQLAIESRQAQQASQIAALQAEQPPLGRAHCVEWLKSTGKPFLPESILRIFRDACKRREVPKRFRPASVQFELLYYPQQTLEAAYDETMRQTIMFPGQERRRG